MDLRVWPNQEADGKYPSSTPGKVKCEDAMQRLTKLAKKHRNGHITKVIRFYIWILRYINLY